MTEEQSSHLSASRVIRRLQKAGLRQFGRGDTEPGFVVKKIDGDLVVSTMPEDLDLLDRCARVLVHKGLTVRLEPTHLVVRR